MCASPTKSEQVVLAHTDLKMLLILGILDIAHTLVEKFCFVAKVPPIAIRPSDRGAGATISRSHLGPLPAFLNICKNLDARCDKATPALYVEVTLFDIKSGSGAPAGRR